MKIFSHKSLFLFVTTLILFLGFNFNFYKTSEKEEFKLYQKDSESLVIGRLIASQQHGLFSKGGLPGSFLNIEGLKEEKNKFAPYVNNQYQIYAEGKKVPLGKFATYNSQIGGQGISFAMIDKISPLSNENNLYFFKGISAFLTALVFSLFLFWVKRTFGIIPAIISILLILLSNWLTLFSRNIWWSLWSFYIPLVWLFYILDKNKKPPLKKLFKVTFLAFFIKCFFTGYEYITTTVLMGFLPIIYYSLESKTTLKEVFKKFIFYTSGVITAISASILILVFQISNSLESLKDGVNHIIYSYKKRANGNPEEFPEDYRASLEANTIDVLKTYLDSTAFRFGETTITFNQAIIFFLFVSVLLYSISFLKKKQQKYTSLLCISWLSILCPISWFVVFKPHSFIHTTMNQITWYMPFMLFGFVLFGVLISFAVKSSRKS